MNWLPLWGQRRFVFLPVVKVDQTDINIFIKVNYVPLMFADFRDVRFTNDDGTTLLSQYTDSYQAGVSALFCVKVPALTAGLRKCICMYYDKTGSADNNWWTIAYGNGLFVAISNTGVGNRVMTSPDGFTWTIRASASDNNWNSICYGNNLFVAVAQSGVANRVMTSPDGINWTIRVSAADNEWNSVCFGAGLFVAVAGNGVGNRVMTSPDGITWTIRASAADYKWAAVTYGSGIFVAVSDDGVLDCVMTSLDGITWTSRNAPVAICWTAITYNIGLFVVTDYCGVGNRIMTSPDGINWTIRVSAADNEWNSVCFGAGLFVAVAGSGVGNRVMTSPDGITWTIRASAADNKWTAVTYGSGIFVAVARSGVGNRVMTSPDGITWTIGSYAPAVNVSDGPNTFPLYDTFDIPPLPDAALWDWSAMGVAVNAGRLEVCDTAGAQQPWITSKASFPGCYGLRFSGEIKDGASGTLKYLGWYAMTGPGQGDDLYFRFSGNPLENWVDGLFLNRTLYFQKLIGYYSHQGAPAKVFEFIKFSTHEGKIFVNNILIKYYKHKFGEFSTAAHCHVGFHTYTPGAEFNIWIYVYWMYVYKLPQDATPWPVLTLGGGVKYAFINYP